MLDAMGAFKNTMPVCPSDQHCSQWARKYMSYCLCDMKDAVALSLGVMSVLSWGVAEIPQIITNYKNKSTEGLSVALLLTWILGDLFNLFGCMLEPATLPTQYYMAALYTLTSIVLTAQAIYYRDIYHRLKRNRRGHTDFQPNQSEAAEKIDIGNIDVNLRIKTGNGSNGSNIFNEQNITSSPIPLPFQNSFPGRELYYMSARSLSSSHTPTAGSFLAQRTSSPTSAHIQNSLEEPLVGRQKSTPPMNIRTTLCVFSAVTFLGTFNLSRSANKNINIVLEKPNQGVVMRVGRKLFQASRGLSKDNGYEVSYGIGTFFGWGMAAIYMGGRLPQIFLNIKRGTVEGLNPLMFVFALVGNATYVGSILVNSLEWSKLRPNLPWLVDAGGCVLLDAFILFQFSYFRCRTPKNVESDG